MGLILIHELGHFLTAYFLGWNTDKICLYPYGGISLFNIKVNNYRKEEWLVLLMGPLFQLIFYFFVFLLLSSSYLKNILSDYNVFLLCFNLLPIYPLDGGRIFLLLISYFKSYKSSFYYILCISYFVFILLGIYFLLSKSLFFLIVLIFLFFKTKKEKQLFPFIFEKFLLERILYTFNFKRRKVVSEVDDMMLDTFHYFKTSTGIVNEKDYLTIRRKKIYK